MLLAEGVFLCALFWGVCWLGTGSDVKNFPLIIKATN